MLPSDPPKRRPLTVLALGFRPFFLAAGIAAVLLILLWLEILKGHIPQPHYLPGVSWHAHEMLFGYTMAVIAGFLLTAARNWSDIPTPTGSSLGALVLLWLAGRLAPWIWLPAWAAALIDLVFIPALIFGLWRALWQSPNRRNRAFVGLLAGMALANGLMHLDGLGWVPGGAAHGQRLMLDLIALLTLVVAGRVLPFFVERGLADARPVSHPRLDAVTYGLMGALLVLHQVQPIGVLAGLTALALCGLQIARLAGWHDPRIWRTPMLTVLFVGLAWMAVWFACDALAAFGQIASIRTIHSLNIGVIGVMTLGMMARVSVGHTGREMHAERLTVAAFWCVNIAAVLRVLGPIMLPSKYSLWLSISGGFWMLAFGLFLWVHAPMLVRPRPDGRPG